MDQAARDWLDSEGSAAFGKWLVKTLERHPDHPEWLAMFADILQGSRLGPTDGWFRLAVAQTRFDWKTVRSRYDRDGDGKIARLEFPGSSEDFARLDRDEDSFVTERDLAWPEHALTNTPGSMLYLEADNDSDGRVTREEFEALFRKADKDGLGFLSQDELRALLPAPAPPPQRPASTTAPARPGGPSKSTLVRGLFEQEIGAMKSGPSRGDLAPDFTLRTADGDRSFHLADLVGEKPVVLVFGNITCGPFRSQAGNVQKVYARYKDRAHFLMVYVREAHPTDGWHMTFNDEFDVKLPQPKSYDERVGVAQTCQRKLGFDMPFLVDSIEDKVGGTYSGMPSRLYVIDTHAKVAYKSGRGPFGFKPAEMEQALLWTLATEGDKPEADAAETEAAGGGGQQAAGAEAKPEAPIQEQKPPASDEARVPLLDKEVAWAMLPVIREGKVPTLPHWALVLAQSLPRTTAAMLVLDHRHRAKSPIEPSLRARMRWVAADSNHCDYSRAYAEFDMKELGMPADAIRGLRLLDDSRIPPNEREALRFAHMMTIDASEVSDDDVKRLISVFGADQVVAMVQLLAYANFQDRLLLALGIGVESDGPRPPVEVRLDPSAEVAAVPDRVKPKFLIAPASPERVDDADWTALDLKDLQERLAGQQSRSSRIPVPAFEDVVKRLPPGARVPEKPVRIQWSLVCMGYQPELAMAWSACTRAFAEDARQDRVFEESLFWVVTRTIHCFY